MFIVNVAIEPVTTRILHWQQLQTGNRTARIDPVRTGIAFRHHTNRRAIRILRMIVIVAVQIRIFVVSVVVVASRQIVVTLVRLLVERRRFHVVRHVQVLEMFDFTFR